MWQLGYLVESAGRGESDGFFGWAGLGEDVLPITALNTVNMGGVIR
jgi:hypothetical protein